ncbi:MAG: hypothetical protein Q9159_001058 [Coniocarpon cinnabarinum]
MENAQPYQPSLPHVSWSDVKRDAIRKIVILRLSADYDSILGYPSSNGPDYYGTAISIASASSSLASVVEYHTKALQKGAKKRWSKAWDARQQTMASCELEDYWPTPKCKPCKKVDAEYWVEDGIKVTLRRVLSKLESMKHHRKDKTKKLGAFKTREKAEKKATRKAIKAEKQSDSGSSSSTQMEGLPLPGENRGKKRSHESCGDDETSIEVSIPRKRIKEESPQDKSQSDTPLNSSETRIQASPQSTVSKTSTRASEGTVDAAMNDQPLEDDSSTLDELNSEELAHDFSSQERGTGNNEHQK